MSDEELAECHFNWNSRLAYGIEFDEVSLPRAGVHTYVDGKRFYSYHENKLYDWYILKLHGSLNWFRYLPTSKWPFFMNDDREKLIEQKKDKVVVTEGHWYWNVELPDIQGIPIQPIIVPPTLYKQDYFDDEVYKRLLFPLWQKAKEALSKCKRLVVIGYAFSDADFATKKLFLETFSRNKLDELVVVNPDTSVVKKLKDLCHFDKPVIVCEDLEEFVRPFDKFGMLKFMKKREAYRSSTATQQKQPTCSRFQ